MQRFELFEAGCLLTFSAFRMGAYSRWALIRGWALIRINTVSLQNALDFISMDVDVKNFPGGACARNSLEQCVRSPYGRYRAHIATVYYISRPPLSQDHPSTPVNCI